MRYDSRSDFLKTATRRLDDARELLTDPVLEPNRSDRAFRHLAAARYLAGYAVECILKLYIINRTRATDGEPAETWGEVLEARQAAAVKPDLSGARGHALPSLLNATDLAAELLTDPSMTEAWDEARKWDYEQRYRAQPVRDRAATESFVDCCGQMHRWVQARIGVVP